MGASHDTSLDHFLRRRGVIQVFLTSIATSISVESSARNDHDHGYHVALVTDAMTDTDPASHRHAIEKIFPRPGETTTTEIVLGLLKKQG